MHNIKHFCADCACSNLAMEMGKCLVNIMTNQVNVKAILKGMQDAVSL